MHKCRLLKRCWPSVYALFLCLSSNLNLTLLLRQPYPSRVLLRCVLFVRQLLRSCSDHKDLLLPFMQLPQFQAPRFHTSQFQNSQYQTRQHEPTQMPPHQYVVPRAPVFQTVVIVNKDDTHTEVTSMLKAGSIPIIATAPVPQGFGSGFPTRPNLHHSSMSVRSDNSNQVLKATATTPYQDLPRDRQG